MTIEHSQPRDHRRSRSTPARTTPSRRSPSTRRRGTFRLSYNGALHRARSRSTRRPSRSRTRSVRSSRPVDPGADVTVAQNGNVYQVTFLTIRAPTPLTIGQATTPASARTARAELVDETILITAGPGEEQDADHHRRHRSTAANWVLILDKPWFSPFTNDASTPTSDSQYTLLSTNPNLLVDGGDAGEPAAPLRHRQPGLVRRPGLATWPGPTGETRSARARSSTTRARSGRRTRAAIVERAEPVPASPASAWAATAASAARRSRSTAPTSRRTPATGRSARTSPAGSPSSGSPTSSSSSAAATNHVTVDTFTGRPRGTSARRRRQIDTGAGNDLVDVKGITGHTFVNLGAGNDTLNVQQRRTEADRPGGAADRQRRQPAGERHQLRERLGGAGHGGRRRRRDPDPHRRGDRRHLRHDADAERRRTTNRRHRSGQLGRRCRRRRATCANDAPATVGRRARSRGPRASRRRSARLGGGIGNFDVQKAGGTYRIHFRARSAAVRCRSSSRPDRPHERRGREGHPQHQRHRRDGERRGAPHLDLADRARHAEPERDAAARRRRDLRAPTR